MKTNEIYILVNFKPEIRFNKAIHDKMVRQLKWVVKKLFMAKNIDSSKYGKNECIEVLVENW
ncbi:MAG: hypothetical protein HQ521_18775 [Bacteroidetes bacterium]|nr:hypothetical protein [Bacteroidota bacterium]